MVCNIYLEFEREGGSRGGTKRFMMLARLLRRPLVAGASQRTRTGLADFFEAGRDPNKDEEIVYGTSSETSYSRCALSWIKNSCLASLFVKLLKCQYQISRSL